MLPDPWLTRWLPLIVERAGNSAVLEIGCGNGDDTRTLLGAGAQVVAFDLSQQAVARAHRRAPQARISYQDVRQPFPHGGEALGAVLASLSLHYFAWDETLALLARIRQTLRPQGLLVCRLNSTEDHLFGASGQNVIAPNYYLVNGEPKRFFDRAAIDSLFAEGWTVLSQEHRVTRKYLAPKALWEIVVERQD